MIPRLAMLAILVLLVAPAWAGLSRQDVDELTHSDPAFGRYSPSASAQLFYHYFDAQPDPQVKPPEWLAKSLKAMRDRRVWKDQELGDMSEAEVWQAPAAALFEFFKVTRRTFPKKKGGEAVKPKVLIDDYELVRSKFGVAVDRLYLARMGRSLGGRGSEIMVMFRQMLPEMRAINSALRLGNDERYRESVMNIADLTERAFQKLNN